MKAFASSICCILLVLPVYAQPHSTLEKPRKAQNIASFARLYGYVRYFYPGDEAAKLDWDKFEMYAIPKVEQARDAVALKGVLDSMFLPIAPALRIFDETHPETFDKSQLVPSKKDTNALKIIRWQHLGMGNAHENGVYQSRRTGRDEGDSRHQFGNLMTNLPAKKYQGRAFIFKAAVKTRLSSDYESSGHLWFRVDRENKKTGFFDNMARHGIRSGDWDYYQITGTIDKDAEYLSFGMMLWGDGKMWVDDAQLYVADDAGHFQRVTELDGDFEKAKEGEQPRPWFQPSGITMYQDDVSRETSKTGDQSICISHLYEPMRLFKQATHMGDYIHKSIGNGLAINMPLAVFGDDDHTYPLPDKTLNNALQGDLSELSSQFDKHPEDPTVMMSSAVKMWNVYEHFYPYFDRIALDWQQALQDLILETYNAKTKDDFEQVLLKYIALTHDGHGKTFSEKSGTQPYFHRPFEWEWVENKLVVTQVYDKSLALHPGDIVLKVGEKDAKTFIDKRLEISPGATPGFKYYRAYSGGSTKDSTKATTILVVDSMGNTHSVTYRFNIPNDEIKYNTSPNTVTWEKMETGIYYLNLNNIDMPEIDSLMPELVKAKSIICDMRGYPKSTIKFIQHLLVKEDTAKNWMRIPEIIYPDHGFSGFKNSGWQLSPVEPHIPAKIFLITDPRAISYAESYTGMLQGYKLATLIGEPTAGTNGNVNSVELLAGYAFRFTGMKVVKLDGTPLFGVGFIPDIPISKTIKGVQAGRDELLEKALVEARR